MYTTWVFVQTGQLTTGSSFGSSRFVDAKAGGPLGHGSVAAREPQVGPATSVYSMPAAAVLPMALVRAYARL
jgi:hypothetical protein